MAAGSLDSNLSAALRSANDDEFDRVNGAPRVQGESGERGSGIESLCRRSRTLSKETFFAGMDGVGECGN